MRKEILQRFIYFSFLLIFIILSFTTSGWSPIDFSDKVRQYTRHYEFDYTRWELSAVWVKFSTASLGSVHYLNNSQQRKIIGDYFALLKTANDLQQRISEIYGGPNLSSLENDATNFESELKKVNIFLKEHKQFAESILQYQIGQSIHALGLADLGTPFPPILFQTTKLPNQLIVSPRETIFQEENVSLIADIELNAIIKLENDIEKDTDYSALVVSVGGVGTYPTMVINTTNIRYLIETVAHEWVHNYLTLRPLGMRYSSSRELRTMNETVASIAGAEISDAVIEMFYSNLVEIEGIKPKTLQASAPASPPNQEVFNFSKEMYETRIMVDELLSKEKIDEAEKYMELRRLIFWENGFHIRKINQAYFAFHGAYADEPFSAAGKDPVGDDVRFFRARQTSLASFIRKMSWMYSYPQLHIAARAY